MNRLICCMALATALTMGCAGAPPTAVNEEGQPAQGAAAPVGAGTADASGVAPAVVELSSLTQAPGSIVSCREVLKTGSNVIVTRCMSADDWVRFKRYQEREAQQMLRTMQRSGFP